MRWPWSKAPKPPPRVFWCGCIDQYIFAHTRRLCLVDGRMIERRTCDVHKVWKDTEYRKLEP